MYIERYLSEIAEGGAVSETAFYTPLSVHILRGLLNYAGKNCLINLSGETGIPDIRLRSAEDDSEWVVCEAKIRDDEIRDEKRRLQVWREQVVEKHYVTAETVYVLMCAPHTFRVYTARNELVGGADLDVERNELADARTGERSPLKDAELRRALELISASASEDRKHYDEFREGRLPGGHLELTTETVGLLRPVFEFALRELRSYCRDSFERFGEEHRAARAELRKISEQMEMVGTEKVLRERVLNRERYIRRKYRVPLQLFEEDYPQFRHDQAYAGTEKEEHFEDIFVTNTAYVALTRLFFVRVCEDMGLTTRKVSHGGPGVWRRFVEHIKDSYRDLLDVAYKDAAQVYCRLFETTIFDWYGLGNGRLNDILERVLFRLNAFSFKQVDRDVLGSIYQYFRPRAERKRMGEYYTPEEVVDYILQRTGIARDPDIMRKRILDPACGSFTFGVRAVGVLLEAGEHLTARNKIGLVQRCLIGRDINPFAVFLSHLSLLFTMLDTYRQAKKERPDYVISGFDVANVNSLAVATGQAELAVADEARSGTMEKEGFDYVVGNPPFVRNERLPEEDREALKEVFAGLRSGNTDLATYFLYSALNDWLRDGGVLGMVAPIGQANAKNAARLREELARYTIYEIVSLEWIAKELFPDADIIPMLVFARREQPPAGHKIAVVTGIAHKSELAQAARDGPFRDSHVSDIDYKQWREISPTGDWPLDITAPDVPVLEQLSDGPRLESAADAKYGIKLGTAGSGIARGPDSEERREQEIPFAKGQHVCAFGMSDPEEVIDLAQISRSSDASIWADLSFYRENAGRRNETGLNGKAFNTGRLLSEYAPSDTLCCLGPKVYTTLAAAAADPISVAVNDSAMVIVPRECSAHLLAAVINSRVSRYYAFLTMRAAILLRRRSTWYPRTIDNLPWPKVTADAALRLHNLAKEAAEISERAELTEMDAYLAAMHRVTDRSTAGTLGVHLADPGSIVQIDDLSAVTSPKENTLVLESGTIVAPDADTLAPARMAALAAETRTIDNHELQNLMLPSSRADRARVAEEVRGLVARLESSKSRMSEIAEEIDEIVAGGVGLTSKEHEVVKRRCSEFPLSVTVGRPRYVWSADRKRQARRIYEDGERFR